MRLWVSEMQWWQQGGWRSGVLREESCCGGGDFGGTGRGAAGEPPCPALLTAQQWFSFPWRGMEGPEPSWGGNVVRVLHPRGLLKIQLWGFSRLALPCLYAVCVGGQTPAGRAGGLGCCCGAGEWVPAWE